MATFKTITLFGAVALLFLSACGTAPSSRQLSESEWESCVAQVEQQVVAEGGSCGGSNCWTADGVNSGVVVMERCGRMPRSAAEAVNSALMEQRYGAGN